MSEAQASVGAGLRERHEALRDLLESNGGLLELLAEIQLDLRLLDPADPVVRARILQLLEATLLQSQTLNLLSNDRHRKLYDVHYGIETGIRSVLGEGQRRLRSDPVALSLSACRTGAQALVGGKAARLGELSERLPGRVPDGFVVTTAAHARLLAHGQTSARLREVMKGLDLATDATRLGALGGGGAGRHPRGPDSRGDRGGDPRAGVGPGGAPARGPSVPARSAKTVPSASRASSRPSSTCRTASCLQPGARSSPAASPST